MKAVAATAITAASLLVVVAFGAPAPGAATGSHYTVHCANEAGTKVVAKSFDARQVERPSSAAHSMEIFKQTNPGGHCWVTGPHRDRPGTPDSNG